MRYIALFMIFVSIAGCKAITSGTKNDPVIVHRIGNAKTADLQVGHILTTIADRREVYVKADGSIVAEPPPDVFEEVTTALNFLASASVAGEVDAAELAVGFSTVRDAMQLAERSQALLYFRDASYRLAEARINNHLTHEEYSSLFKQLIEDIKVIMRAEAKLFYENLDKRQIQTLRDRDYFKELFKTAIREVNEETIDEAPDEATDEAATTDTGDATED
jgi:hypothetical protein